MNVNKISAEMYALYGSSAGVPSLKAWEDLENTPDDRAVTLLNFFKLRPEAVYDGKVSELSGEEALQAYSRVSMPALASVGGSFLYMGRPYGCLIGAEETWDMLVIGTYPDKQAVMKLFENDAYQSAFKHRVAACERQRVVMCVS